jgi:hypothetical protein
MKAIYISLDPYLAQIADYAQSATADEDEGTITPPNPKFDPLPIAITLPVGESAVLYLDGGGTLDDVQPNFVTIGSVTLVHYSLGAPTEFGNDPEVVATNTVPGLSSIDPQGKYLAVKVPATVSEFVVKLFVSGLSDLVQITIPISVLVRRETASGPVDLVDFTPPASAIAAGTDLKGATFDGNEIVAAAGTGALSAPAGA